MSTVEKQEVTVFGTKEVPVKEFIGSSDKSLMLLSDYEKAKQNLLELKEKHQARVEELVTIEKLPPKELKELNDIRAELREPRYLVQNIEKNNISVFEAYKRTDKANLRELIEINSDLEDKATTKLQAEEQRKKDEKEAEAKAEELRVTRITKDIENIETYCLEVIQKMNFENLKVSSELVEQSLNAEYEFEEYDLLLDQVKSRVIKSLLDKTNDITERENQRLENEKMKQDIFDVRVIRLKEIGFELLDSFFTSNQFEMKLGRLAILDMSSADFENQLVIIKRAKDKDEQAKRDAELKKQKDEQFEVRKSRLAEIGFEYKGGQFFYFKLDTNGNTDATIEVTLIEDASVTEFEKRLANAKLLIADIIREKELADQQAKEAKELELKSQEEAKKKAATEQKKADAENKARVKRLATDKKIISESLEVYFADLHLETENQETKDFIESANAKILALKSELLTQLNEL